MLDGQNSEGMCQGGKPGTGKLYTDPPTPVGAWSMALGLRQRFEYYYVCLVPASAHPSALAPLVSSRPQLLSCTSLLPVC